MLVMAIFNNICIDKIKKFFFFRCVYSLKCVNKEFKKMLFFEKELVK